MKDKKIIYLAWMAGIVLFTILVPFLVKTVKTATHAFISRIGAEATEWQAEDDPGGRYLLQGFDETEGEGGKTGEGAGSSGNADIPADGYEQDPDLTGEEIQKQKEEADEKRSAYLNAQSPALRESRQGMLEVFCAGKEEMLINAVADHLYSSYGDLYQISDIDVVDFVGESGDEITCQVRVSALVGEKSYSEYYFCTYNTAYDFYSVYAYHE